MNIDDFRQIAEAVNLKFAACSLRENAGASQRHGSVKVDITE